MAKNTNSDGTIQHIAAVRYRLLGSGALKTRLYSMDFVRSQQLPSITMSSATDIQPTTLANFRAQGICIDFRTTEKDEIFDLSKIVAFIKPVSNAYPQ